MCKKANIIITLPFSLLKIPTYSCTSRPLPMGIYLGDTKCTCDEDYNYDKDYGPCGQYIIDHSHWMGRQMWATRTNRARVMAIIVNLKITEASAGASLFVLNVFISPVCHVRWHLDAKTLCASLERIDNAADLAPYTVRSKYTVIIR